MIGRGCYGRPWFLPRWRITCAPANALPDPSLARAESRSCCGITAPSARISARRRGVRLARKHVAWYIARPARLGRVPRGHEPAGQRRRRGGADRRILRPADRAAVLSARTRCPPPAARLAHTPRPARHERPAQGVRPGQAEHGAKAGAPAHRHRPYPGPCPSPVVVLDENDMFAALNHAAEQFFGASKALLLHTPLNDLLPVDNPVFLMLERARRSRGEHRRA